MIIKFCPKCLNVYYFDRGAVDKCWKCQKPLIELDFPKSAGGELTPEKLDEQFDFSQTSPPAGDKLTRKELDAIDRAIDSLSGKGKPIGTEDRIAMLEADVNTLREEREALLKQNDELDEKLNELMEMIQMLRKKRSELFKYILDEKPKPAPRRLLTFYPLPENKRLFAAEDCKPEPVPSPKEDFGMDGTVLVKYKGKGGDVVIPKGVTSIGKSAFSGCDALTSVSIPDSVTSIGDCAFSGCDALTSVTIPESVTSIGYSAFWGCKALESVTIPDSVTSIGSGAFCGCKALESVTIPDSVTSIGEAAFLGCEALESVTIPKSVLSIGQDAFSRCGKLTLRVYPNTEGEAYAKRENKKYELIK